MPGQQYKHSIEYKGKRLSLRLETVCHNAYILKNIQIGSSLNFVSVCIFIKHSLLYRYNEINKNSVNQNQGQISLKITPWGR